MKLIHVGLLGVLLLGACNENQEMPSKIAEKPDCEKVIYENFKQKKNHYESAVQNGTYPMPYYVSAENIAMTKNSENELLCIADTIMSDEKLQKVQYRGTLRNGKWSYQAQY